jgi:hypothetical protein
MKITHGLSPFIPARPLLIVAAAFLLGVAGNVGFARVASAVPIIPSIGLSKSTDSNSGDAKVYGGLALRVPLASILAGEVGISYRQESFLDENLKVRMWPVTASLWLKPAPMLYLGGGIGWYKTTFDYAETFPAADHTTSNFGEHIGGGLSVPLGPRVGLDLNGRYIFMSKENDAFLPSNFNPDFWTTSLGLALNF